MPGAHAILMDFASRRILRTLGNPSLAAFPGSALKPFVIASLLGSGKLSRDERFLCPVELALGGRSYTCTHPRLQTPMTAPTAIAYSCNCYVAHFARRLAPGELARDLARMGFAPSLLSPATKELGIQMQALGQVNVQASPRDLAFAYRSLAANPNSAILEGLEAAVDYGTAQHAQIPNARVAGKTGTAPGNAAWFAGFAPSRSPRLVVAVLTGGRSGGADAAPVAARLLEEHLQ